MDLRVGPESSDFSSVTRSNKKKYLFKTTSDTT